MFADSSLVSAPAAFAGATGNLDPIWVVLLVVGGASLALMGQAAFAWWHGARFRSRPTEISSLRAGRVTVSGIAEPAWAVATSPFGKRACIWYDARSIVGQYKSARLIFLQTNAVSFVLRDGTGRVLVLGRRARWDASGGHPGSVPHSQAGDLAKELGRPLEDSEDYLDSYSDPDSPDRAGTERVEELVAVGERVTVSGRASSDPAQILRGSDSCPDAGQSIGLPGAFVIGPDRFSGLSIVSGYLGGVASTGRARLMLGVLGLGGAVSVSVGSVVLILAGNRA